MYSPKHGITWTPSEVARVLHDTIAGIGTDEQTIDNVFSFISDQENPEKYLRNVADAYMKEYRSDLGKDLRNDLSDTELRNSVYIPMLGGNHHYFGDGGHDPERPNAISILGIKVDGDTVYGFRF